MNIVILGAGSIGSYLAHVLSKEEHNVTIIDRNPKTLEKIARSADVGTCLGSGTDWQLLEDLIEQSPHLFIALSREDETNLTACAIAKNLGYPKTVARIKQNSYLNRSRLDFGRLFFVDHFIGTDVIVAQDIFKSLLNPGNAAIENFAHGAVQMRTLVIPPHWQFSGKKIRELHLPDNLLVGLVRRKDADNRETIIFPRGNDALFSGDEITVIGETKIMQQTQKIFGSYHKNIKSVVIAGGSTAALHLCHNLEAQGITVKIIEKDEEVCKRLAEDLPHTTILNQDTTDLNFLLAEKIGHADAFVASTSSNETNILSAALAKQAGCEEVIALVSDASYAPLLRRLGIFYTVSARVSFANRIHSIIQAESVISVASLYENQAKIMEIKVSADSQIVGIPISDLSTYLPQDFLIALIENRGRIMIAKGNNILAPGDTVILITSPKHVQELEKIF
jgi:trk system potassium uptake protein